MSSPAVIELRIHGAGGATPEEMLDVDEVELVAGAPDAGFFRPRHRAEVEGIVREGYSWGGLTSASARRALWVLLWPFALMNLAGWMLPHGGSARDPRRRRRSALEAVTLGAVRLFGGLITALVSLIAAIAWMDLLGYQCGADPACVNRWWLWWWPSWFVDGVASTSVGVGAALAVLSLLSLALVARRGQLVAHPDGIYQGTDDPAWEVNLTHRTMWESPHVPHRLGMSHAAVAVATVGVAAASVAGQSGVVLGGTWIVLVGSLLSLTRLRGVPSWLAASLMTLALVGFGIGLVGLWLEVVEPVGRRLLELDEVARALRVSVPATALVALVGSVLIRRRERQPADGGVVLPIALMLSGSMLVEGFGAGLLIRLADLLGVPVVEEVGQISADQIVYSAAVADVATIALLVLLAMAVAGVVLVLGNRSGPGCEELGEIYSERGGLDCTDPDDQAWARRVGRAVAFARITDRIGATAAGLASVLVGGLGLAVWWGDDIGLGLGGWADPIAEPASVVLSLLPVVGVVVVARLYQSRRLRRTVGVAWDVLTLLPRWFHPWAPPSYGERAVPDLTARLGSLSEDGGVVISGHSQGSVLALAVLAASDFDPLRLALLTHGSPVSRLYTRYLPELVDASLIDAVSQRLTGWVNLWRPTDYVGGAIDGESVENVELVDPPSSRPSDPSLPPPLPRRHSDYDLTPEYRSRLAALADWLAAGGGSTR